MDLTNDDQEAYSFAPKNVDGSIAFHRHMISVVLFFYSNILQIILVDCVVIEMGCLDDYSDAAPCAKNNEGGGLLLPFSCTVLNLSLSIK